MTSTANPSNVPPFLLAGVSVVHPPHLEGDPTLATEILPGPPSLAAIRQQARKVDPKKPPVIPLSYLPNSDPGTTYAGLSGGLQALVLSARGPRRKRARVDRGTSNLAQRPSNSLSGSTSQTDDIEIVEQGTLPLTDVANMDVDNPSAQHTDGGSFASRSPSSEITYCTPSTSAHKGRESAASLQETIRSTTKDKSVIRVKEEPAVTQIHDIQPQPAVTNEDHCSSCSSTGALIYCDGCPRAFHLWCLNPPMEASDLPEGENRWFCPACKPPQNSPLRIQQSIISPLIQQIQSALPVEFKLPEDIRTYFRDVGTGFSGSYVDSSRAKPPRVGRHGLGEERDPYRLRDSKGSAVLCYRCGKSALPDDTASGQSLPQARQSNATQPSTNRWRTIVSCDFCPLHWHIDCLDPPLSCLPPLSKKWRCPNHAINLTPSQRIPKANNAWVDIAVCGEKNNGIIEVVNIDTPAMQPDITVVDELHINGRRYRVPERVILLDFWSRIKQSPPDRLSVPEVPVAGSSSPLTSLSSLHESDESSLQPRTTIQGDIRTVAEVLCSLQGQQSGGRELNYAVTRTFCERSTQTGESAPAVSAARVKAEEHASTVLSNGIHTNQALSQPAVSKRNSLSKRNNRRARAPASSSTRVQKKAPQNASAPSRITRSASVRTPVMTPAPAPQQQLINGIVPYGQSLPSASTRYTASSAQAVVATAPPRLIESRTLERTISGVSVSSTNGSKKPESSHTNPSGSPSKSSLLTIRIPARKPIKPGSPTISAAHSQTSMRSSGTSSGADSLPRRSLRRQPSSHSSMDMSPAPSSVESM